MKATRPRPRGHGPATVDEADEAAEAAQEIGYILASRGPAVQGVALALVTARWLAGFHAIESAEQKRVLCALLDAHCRAILDLACAHREEEG